MTVDVWSLLQWSLNACFFLNFRKSILNLLYLCNFASQGSEISSCGSPLSLISNPTVLIKIGFFKNELCPISHDDLIIDFFNNVKLYEDPCVTVATFVPENTTQKTTVSALSTTIYEILIQCWERKLWQVSQRHLFYMKFGCLQNPNFLKSYLWKYSEPGFEIWSRGSSKFLIKWVLISDSEVVHKKRNSENSTMTYLNPQNPY